jgi:hypothetical protein
MLYYENFLYRCIQITYTYIDIPTHPPKVMHKIHTSQNFFKIFFQNLETYCVCGDVDHFQSTTPPMFG